MERGRDFSDLAQFILTEEKSLPLSIFLKQIKENSKNLLDKQNTPVYNVTGMSN
jgi:hypothetical protein